MTSLSVASPTHGFAPAAQSLLACGVIVHAENGAGWVAHGRAMMCVVRAPRRSTSTVTTSP